ncbi:MAG TPA: hypothetical protein VJH92_04060 [Candidatus Nanoarchaeia archaeon]|nr:hypothetical protein [Candidatus Nanoarchaeia archaeon]
MLDGKDYTEEDLEDSLRRAFVDRRGESILMDGHEARSEFKRDVVNYGIDKGWLRKERDINESQYTAMTYILTGKGKKHFGL